MTVLNQASQNLIMGLKLDQHTMTDRAVIRKMVESADIRSDETVLEIGAGSGSLTRQLAKKTRHVIAVEIDKKFEPELKKMKNVEPVIGNALKEIGRMKFDKIIANIPYAICEPLIGRLIDKDKKFKLAVLTIPKGFADILSARKGTPKYSKISLLSGIFFDVQVLLDVPRKAFEPPPKADSVAVRMVPKEGNELQKEVMKRQRLKAKNAIIRGLFASRNLTKKQARKAINTMKLNNKLLEKRLFEADLNELDAVLDALERLEKKGTSKKSL